MFKVITSYFPKIEVGMVFEQLKFEEEIAGEEWYSARFWKVNEKELHHVGVIKFALHDVEYEKVKNSLPAVRQY